MKVTEMINQMLPQEAPYQKNRAESEGKSDFVRMITENNTTHIYVDVKAGNRPVLNGTHGGVRGQIGN